MFIPPLGSLMEVNFTHIPLNGNGAVKNSHGINAHKTSLQRNHIVKSLEIIG